MITTTQMYWLVTMDSIVHASAIIAIALGVMAFLTIPMVLDDDDLPKWTPSAIALVAVAFALVAAFVPTTRQMAAIVMVPKIANNEKVQAAGNKLYDLAVEWMDELRPRKKAGDEEK